MKNRITKVNSKKMSNIDWGIDSSLSKILNEIDILPEKRVFFTVGERQFINDNGQMYQTVTRSVGPEIAISKTNFIEQTGDFKVNQMCNYNKNGERIIDHL